MSSFVIFLHKYIWYVFRVYEKGQLEFLCVTDHMVDSRLLVICPPVQIFDMFGYFLRSEHSCSLQRLCVYFVLLRAQLGHLLPGTGLPSSYSCAQYYGTLCREQACFGLGNNLFRNLVRFWSQA